MQRTKKIRTHALSEAMKQMPQEPETKVTIKAPP